MGIATDGVNLFVADDIVVRNVVIARGAVTTLAGAPEAAGAADRIGAAARFGELSLLSYDGHGSLFLADQGNSTIRRLVLANDEVDTVAGSPSSAGQADGFGAAALFNSPAGLAIDTTCALYVADTYNDTLRVLL